MDMAFKKITNYDKLLLLLKKFNNYFPETLEYRVGDLTLYARKLLNLSEIYTLEVNNSVAGIIIYYANDFINKNTFITMIAVDIKHMQKGLGSLLLNKCEEHSKELGMKKIILEVDKRNKNAIYFYKKKGFDFSKKASENTYFMEKELKNVSMDKKRNYI